MLNFELRKFILKIKKWIKKQLAYIYIKEKKREFLNRQPNTFGLSKKEIYRAFKLGFTPEEYAIYDLRHNNPNDYISEWERQCFRKLGYCLFRTKKTA